ncbi:MAG TPA: hypothetical protein VMT30_08405 [Candidatus Saccharimonadia bacterium]|nr:hypothetical protein [Candidatus Saccharimonadia bacterium]
MKKAVVLIIGVLVYLWFLQAAQDVAASQLTELQYLYTSSGAQAAAISNPNR